MRSRVYPNEADIDAEVNIALQSKEASQVKSTLLMKELGLQRAKQHGWDNTYAFTKAMGEMLISKQRENIPVVIIRPSVIESAYREPLPGWIEGNSVGHRFYFPAQRDPDHTCSQLGNHSSWCMELLQAGE